MSHRLSREVVDILEKSREMTPHAITEDDIRGLPEPVQRNLRYTRIVGRKRIRTVRLEQRGFFRTKPGQRWMRMEAEQYFTVDPPAFVWFGAVRPLPFLSIAARDMFADGKGSMLVKLARVIRMADARGPEVDQGALLRYLAEIIWFPTAYLSDYITWEPVDADSAKATIRVRGTTASAVLHFDEKGQLQDSVSKRYMDAGGRFSLETWSTPISDYMEVDGIRVPARAEVLWKLSSGDFSYFKADITRIEYDRLPVPRR